MNKARRELERAVNWALGTGRDEVEWTLKFPRQANAIARYFANHGEDGAAGWMYIRYAKDVDVMLRGNRIAVYRRG